MKEEHFSFVIYVDNAGYPTSLELHKVYRVLYDESAESEGDLRVVDESGEDYLYPAGRFVRVELPEAVEKSFLQSA